MFGPSFSPSCFCFPKLPCDTEQVHEYTVAQLDHVELTDLFNDFFLFFADKLLELDRTPLNDLFAGFFFSFAGVLAGDLFSDVFSFSDLPLVPSSVALGDFVAGFLADPEVADGVTFTDLPSDFLFLFDILAEGCGVPLDVMGVLIVLETTAGDVELCELLTDFRFFLVESSRLSLCDLSSSFFFVCCDGVVATGRDFFLLDGSDSSSETVPCDFLFLFPDTGVFFITVGVAAFNVVSDSSIFFSDSFFAFFALPGVLAIFFVADVGVPFKLATPDLFSALLLLLSFNDFPLDFCGF